MSILFSITSCKHFSWVRNLNYSLLHSIWDGTPQNSVMSMLTWTVSGSLDWSSNARQGIITLLLYIFDSTSNLNIVWMIVNNNQQKAVFSQSNNSFLLFPTTDSVAVEAPSIEHRTWSLQNVVHPFQLIKYNGGVRNKTRYNPKHSTFTFDSPYLLPKLLISHSRRQDTWVGWQQYKKGAVPPTLLQLKAWMWAVLGGGASTPPVLVTGEMTLPERMECGWRASKRANVVFTECWKVWSRVLGCN